MWIMVRSRIRHLARAKVTSKGTSNAQNISILKEQILPELLVFGHRNILKDYFFAPRKKERP